MGFKIWIGGTNDSFTESANWDPVNEPADLDNLIFNDQAVGPLLSNINGIAAKSFGAIFEDNFNQKVGTSAAPLKPVGWTTVIVKGKSQNISLHGGSAGDMDRLFVDMSSTKDNALNIQGGTINDIILMRGSMQVAAGTIDGRITIHGTNGNSPGVGQTKLTLDSGLTLSGLVVVVKGGELDFSTTIPTLNVEDGRAIISGTAGVSTLLEQAGGEVWWVANSSTIADLRVRGGMFMTRNSRSGRTITKAEMSDNGRIDISKGGLLLTMDGGIIVNGVNMPVVPSGSKVTISLT